MRHQTTRRDFLAAGAASTVGFSPKSLGAVSGQTTVPREADNPVVRENAKSGTRDWLLGKTAVSPPDPLWHMYGLRSQAIEGFCSRASVAASEELQVYVSTTPESKFTVDVFRMGYYGGAGGRKVASFGPLQGHPQLAPSQGPNRVMECQWSPSLKIEIPSDWLSGVYLGKLRELRTGTESYIIFIVRDERRADYLFQCSDMTWQAYNRWPSQHSLYCNGTRDNHVGSGVDVSVDRPYGKYTQLVDQPLTLGSGEWFLWEYPLAYWMEQQGYDVSYLSNWDTHADPEGLRRAKGFLSVGHDEYWTPEMFANVKNAIQRGVNVAFLSGNSVFCKIRLKPGIGGQANRVFERDGRFQPRENTLIGAHSAGPVIGGADWTCVQPDHWLFSGTGMKQGDGIRGLVGWEFHGDPADIPGLEIVATGPTDNRRFPDTQEPRPNRSGVYTSTVYPGPRGNFVFNAATCWWADGLSSPPGYLRSQWYQPRHGPDERLQRMTANLLARMQ